MQYCSKCKKTMDEKEFYGSNNLEKYPTGRLNQCKKCISMHVDNWEPDTYLWILQESDVPYVVEEWNKLMATYARDRSRVNGTTILGRYLSKMKLKQWKDYRWKDTAFLQELADKRTKEVYLDPLYFYTAHTRERDVTELVNKCGEQGHQRLIY